MNPVRRTAVALAAMVLLVVLQAAADPTGLLALVGWQGAELRFDLGLWPLAPYLVFIPVLLAMTWWTTLRAGNRFWTHVAGLVLAVLLAQAAACLAMTWDPAVAGWAAGFVAAKAVPAALIVALVTRWLGGQRNLVGHDAGSLWIPAAVLAVAAPLLAGHWWTGAVYAPGIPVARIDRGFTSSLVAMLLLAVCALPALRLVRARVPGVLGGWIAALVAGGAVGVVQGVVGFMVDGGFRGDIWPLMALYVAVADGLAFGACTGWMVGLVAVALDRRRVALPARVAVAATASAGAVALVLSLGLPGIMPRTGVDGAKNPAAPAMPAPFLRADGSIIADGDGNQVLLRGANVNQLVDFYQYDSALPVVRPLTEVDYSDMASHGFNVVRLNISWSALEPVRGAVNAEYLGRIKQAVAWGKQHGIYTVLDMHQDGWWNGPSPEDVACRPGTEPMWGYDGAPEWATITDGAPRCQFTGRDISPAGDRAFQHFYFDTDGIQTALAQTWGKLAGEFKDEPMVAGFDLLNEPGFGETAPVTTAHQLGAFFDRAITEIRAAGAPQMVFIEPSILWSGLGFDTGPIPGFTDDPNIVFSPHLYAESITMDRDLGIPPIVGMERQFQLAQRVADSYGAPLWSGEYGYWGESADVESRMARYAATEDQHMLGSAYWVWKQACGDPQNGVGSTGNGLMVQDCATGGDAAPQTVILDHLSRAYPMRTPGKLTSLAAQGPAFQLAGTTTARNCGLKMWIPGSAQPAVEGTGVTDIKATQVPGGWQLAACAEGAYTLRSK
ncbi:glycoside hydrolase family 5 protein [Arthrobacter sp. HY1533]|uniref:glycoside hydrolase family 5 protein n=1 Tax=Arthrobacter sp. HY1533 TaxID=2970919 RepID=UPI0022B9E430|nr:cellulase family glycosylhydrolase [Arthrobacter sp. HY1533]